MFECKENGWPRVTRAKKKVKSLLFCLAPSTFSKTVNTAILQSSYYCTPKNYTVEKNKTNFEPFQMEDILLPNAKLDVFVIELNESTKEFLENTEKKQDEVLKFKEVNEERLRMVVQL